MIALAFDEDRKDRPFCEDAILPVERTVCSTCQHIRACRSGSLCVPLIPSTPSGPGLSGLPHPSFSSHNSLASRIQEFNRHTRVIGPPSFYLLLYYFYFSVHASLRFFTSSSAHSFPFFLFISSSDPSPVHMIKSLTHSLTHSFLCPTSFITLSSSRATAFRRGIYIEEGEALHSVAIVRRRLLF